MAHSSQFGDTTYTKVFVGGLAWETQRDTMRKYFEQFGEILEAVVITDRVTGRSKGYGFVTFKDSEAARRACIDATPIIDGRRANCNLASLGQKHRQQGQQQPGPQAGGPGYTGNAFPAPAQTAPYVAYPPQQFGYSPYGYPSQFAEGYAYPQGMFAPYGAQQFAPAPGVYGGPGSVAAPGGLYAGGAFPGYAPQALPGGAGFAAPQTFAQGVQPSLYGGPGQYSGQMPLTPTAPAPQGAGARPSNPAGQQLPLSLGAATPQYFSAGGTSSDTPS